MTDIPLAKRLCLGSISTNDAHEMPAITPEPVGDRSAFFNVLPTPLYRAFEATRFCMPIKSAGTEEGASVRIVKGGSVSKGTASRFAFGYTSDSDKKVSEVAGYTGFVTSKAVTKPSVGPPQTVGSILRAYDPILVPDRYSHIKHVAALSTAVAANELVVRSYADDLIDLPGGVSVVKSVLRGNANAFFGTPRFEAAVKANNIEHNAVLDKYVLLANVGDPTLGVTVSNIAQNGMQLLLSLSGLSRTQSVRLAKSDARVLLGTESPTIVDMSVHPMLIFVDAAEYKSMKQLNVVGIAMLNGTDTVAYPTVAARSLSIVSRLNDLHALYSAALPTSPRPPTTSQIESILDEDARSVPLVLQPASAVHELVIPLAAFGSRLISINVNAACKAKLLTIKNDDIAAAIADVDKNADAKGGISKYFDSLVDQDLTDDDETERRFPILMVLELFKQLRDADLPRLKIGVRKSAGPSGSGSAEEDEDGGDGAMSDDGSVADDDLD
jgi:hypothetical protein